MYVSVKYGCIVLVLNIV